MVSDAWRSGLGCELPDGYGRPDLEERVLLAGGVLPGTEPMCRAHWFNQCPG